MNAQPVAQSGSSQTALRRVLLRTLTASLLAAPVWLQAQSAITLEFEHRNLDYAPVHYGLQIESQTAVFPKEPKLTGPKIIRGGLKFWQNATNTIPFVWDQSAARLYLDLNRNRDLTDDAPLADTSGAKERRNTYSQIFNGIPLTFDTPQGKHRCLVDLTLYTYTSQTMGSLGWRSFWETQLTLDGQDYQLGFIENPYAKFQVGELGSLLLRPWEERQKPFNNSPGNLDVISAPKSLFFRNQGFELVSSYAAGETPKLQVTLQPWQPELGQLDISGKFIHRLLLTGTEGKRSLAVLLDKPAERVKVPVGNYGLPQVHVRAGNRDAYLEGNRYGSPQAKAFTISPTSVALLVAGGPLTNTVSVQQRGPQLNLSYRLVGAEGKTYQMLNEDRSRPPQFKIAKGSKTIHSGKFEFG